MDVDLARLNASNRQDSYGYFRQLLAGKSAPTPLPCAEPPTRPLPAMGYGERLHELGTDVTDAARALADSTSTNLASVVEAAWALVLARHTAELDVVFGITRSCRSALDGEAQVMIGLFVNALPVRARLQPERTVSELLTELFTQRQALRDHEHCALLEIQRQAGFGPQSQLFETLLIFEAERLLDSAESRWAHSELSLHEQPWLPLNLEVCAGASLTLRALYDRRRFQESAIDRLLLAFEVALSQISQSGQRRLAELDVLSKASQKRILFEWNDTARPFPAEQCIHEAFEAQVQRCPDAIAVEMNGQQLTYRELEERSNRLAHLLRARGARPSVYVGVCLSRSIELIVALVAVAKSGAAYVPLDPQYPRERLDFMLQDAQVLLVLTEQQYQGLFGVPLLVLDAQDAAATFGTKSQRPERISSADDVCYAIFTSGSTGAPKGVVLSHRAVVNTLDWVARTFEFAPGDRLLFVTSPCFDLSVFDTFGVLGAGGTVVVASSELLRDPAALAVAIVEQAITVWDSAPAALQRLVDFFPASSASSPLRLVMLSGDWIPMTLPTAVREAFPKASVKSLGGATEAAIWSNWFPIETIDPRWNSIPYGKPIQNCHYHVLDQRLRPLPIGVTGDLYIGGVCLANGYLNREQLTRERFVPDPFRPASRLYKTGDLARYFEDGNLEFLGRADFQVKIRGFRVELGEVEAALTALPGVREAVCTAYQDASGQKSLLAYVVPENGATPQPETLKESLASKLPDFMLPSQIILLSAMPLSRNGKLDRKALPDPKTLVNTDAFVAPRSLLERRVVSIWEELLQRTPIGIHEDFFKLGGHSLLAVMLVSRLKAQLGLDVRLSQMMERPTIEGLLRSNENSTEIEPEPASLSHVVTLSGRGARPPLFLFPGAGGYGFVYRDLAVLLGEDQPVYSLRAVGAESSSGVFDRSVEDIAEVYLRELLATRPSGPYVLAGYSFGALVAFEVAHRLHQLGERVPLLISLDGFAPGFPPLMNLPQRVMSHVKTFYAADAQGRRTYIEMRLNHAKRRVLQALGRADEAMEDIPFADEAMNQRMRKVLASVWAARGRYSPTYVEPCDLLLIKAATPQRWTSNDMTDPLYGWRRFVHGAVSVRTVPGEHLRLFEGNQAVITRAIAEHIEAYLEPCVSR